jgi:hypothetical protein
VRAQVKQLDYFEMQTAIGALGLGGSDYTTMSNCLMLSDLYWVGTIEGKIACIFGLAPPSLLSNSAYLWLYSTELVDGHKFIFARHSQRVMEDLLKVYPRIVGHCDPKSWRSIRWVKWLGGKFMEPDGRRIPFVIGG